MSKPGEKDRAPHLRQIHEGCLYRGHYSRLPSSRLDRRLLTTRQTLSAKDGRHLLQAGVSQEELLPKRFPLYQVKSLVFAPGFIVEILYLFAWGNPSTKSERFSRLDRPTRRSTENGEPRTVVFATNGIEPIPIQQPL
jgi:hypothetical protein